MDTTKMIKVKLTRQKKDFTIAEIIEEAKKNFDFNCEKGDTLYKRIRRRIEREWKGKIPCNESERNQRYTRADAHKLLNSDLYDFFLDISQEWNEQEAKRLESEFPDRAEERQQAAKKAVDSADAKKEIQKDYCKRIMTYLSESAEAQCREAEGIMTEEDLKSEIDFKVRKKRRELFVDFLCEHFFDVFIDFNEDLYREDWKYQPDATDPLPDEMGQLAGTRLVDDNNYCKLKVASFGELEKSQEELKKSVEEIRKSLADIKKLLAQYDIK